MKVYSVQFDIVWENQPANFAKIESMLEAAQPDRNSLVLLPEMFACGFTMNVEQAVEEKGNQREFIRRIAKEHDVYVVGGVVAPGPDGKGQNQSVAHSPAGDEIACYTKMQPFNVRGEGDAYPAGNEPVTFDWCGVTVAPFICYDLRFPEVFRLIAQSNVELITVMASWPDKRILHWVRLLQARAIENQCHIVASNRCGTDPHLNYNGRSLIADFNGEILADAGDREEVLSVDLDFELLREYRAGLPFLKDMRQDLIGRPLT
ncbi:MAG: amidohydrolase [Verrucomicrobiales bacterium]|nr:amidohydrolase [Verrucomicrobiales bacterium]|tara:strand:+ start:2374 stop:3159 length:786 start_codon:yes stop_codon:yes gene_type:complete